MDERFFLRIENLKVTHNGLSGNKTVLNIDELNIKKGETFGVIGESGTGKTVLALTILKLLEVPPGRIESGSIFLDDENLLKKSTKEMQQKIRGKKISMIFQDPMSTLNPVFTVKQQMIPVICENRNVNKGKASEMALSMLRRVKLPDAERIMDKYPHELSGGQRQRIIIALALVCGAEFIIADEPTRNLDVTIQAGILKLIKELQSEYKMTVMFISNNPSLVSVMCDRAAVLYGGEILEIGTSEEVMQSPKHPYTMALLNSVPVDGQISADGVAGRVGAVPNACGCVYQSRCAYFGVSCNDVQGLIGIGKTHFVRCSMVKAGDNN